MILLAINNPPAIIINPPTNTPSASLWRSVKVKIKINTIAKNERETRTILKIDQSDVLTIKYILAIRKNGIKMTNPTRN
jgi:hypothetical protein